MRVGYSIRTGADGQRHEHWITYTRAELFGEVVKRVLNYNESTYDHYITNGACLDRLTLIEELRGMRPNKLSDGAYPLWKRKFGAVVEEKEEDDTIKMTDDELYARYLEFDETMSERAFVRTARIFQDYYRTSETPSVELLRTMRGGRNCAPEEHPEFVEWLRDAGREGGDEEQVEEDEQAAEDEEAGNDDPTEEDDRTNEHNQHNDDDVAQAAQPLDENLSYTSDRHDTATMSRASQEVDSEQPTYEDESLNEKNEEIFISERAHRRAPPTTKPPRTRRPSPPPYPPPLRRTKHRTTPPNSAYTVVRGVRRYPRSNPPTRRPSPPPYPYPLRGTEHRTTFSGDSKKEATVGLRTKPQPPTTPNKRKLNKWLQDWLSERTEEEQEHQSR